MDSLDAQLVGLIGEAIVECEAVATRATSLGPQWLSEVASESVQSMRRYVESAQRAELPRPSEGAGLGFNRALGEWAQDQAVLMQLASKIDLFYKVNCNCPRKGG